MGCCISQQRTQEAVILTQIQKAVQEQEEMSIIENVEQERNDIIEQPEPMANDKKQEEYLAKIQKSEEEEDKQEKKQQKTKTTKRDENYLKIIEYKSIKINYYILTPKYDEVSMYYDFIINTSHLDFQYEIKCKAIVTSEPEQPFSIKPYSYLEASSNSSYDIFFRNDTYFTIDQQLNTNRQSFDTLLEVERTLKKKKEQIILPSAFQLRSQKQEDSQQNLNSPRRSPKKQKGKIQTEVISEMLEVMHVFDMELCPRFHQLLFFLMVQQQMAKLKPYLVNISEVYFLFDQKPSLDEQQVQKIAIFYEFLDYNLQELQDYLKKEKKQLSHLLFLRLSLDLTQIFYYCYSSYTYRCNFTLKSVYYTNKNKKFKLQAFARLQTLIRFSNEEDVQQLLQSVSEQKFKFFIKDFEKDFGALCDLILLFKNVDNQIGNIKKIRRKKKNSDLHHQKYAEFAMSLLDSENTDKLIYELIRLKCQPIDKDNFDYILEEIKTLIMTLEQQIQDEIYQREKLNDLKEQMILQNESIIKVNNNEKVDFIAEEENELHRFETNLPKKSKKQKVQPSENDLFNEMKYSALFYFETFMERSMKFLEICTNDAHRAYALILQSIGQTMNIPSREQKLAEQQLILQEASKLVLKEKVFIIQDSFHYYLLLTLISSLVDKPIQLLNQLKSLIQQQNTIRRKQIRPKLSTHQTCTGIIEMRKALILDLFYIDHYLKRHLFQNATQLVQHIVTQQLRFNLKSYLLYGRSLFISGIICEKMMQPVSAMLNLEVCRLLYQQFFPVQKFMYLDEETNQLVDVEYQESNKQYKQIMIHFENEGSENLNILEFNLGLVYFTLSEKENALKCLRKVKEAREKKYDLVSDEVLEVVLQILKIHVEQEENGAALEICQEYYVKFKYLAKQNILTKSRLIARLQLIMAAIYECNMMLVSALKYYQKANKTFAMSKNNSYVRQLHILQKIRKIVELIKLKAYQSHSLEQQSEFNIEHYLGHLSEKVKPYFNNQFIRMLENDKIVLYNVTLMKRYIRANQSLRNLEYQQALRRYQRIHQKFKKKKIDECYGFTLEKIGTIYLIQRNLKIAIQHLKMASELHDRYLQFPLKEMRILTCEIYILLGYAILRNVKEVQKQLTHIDDFIQNINDLLNWQNVPYKQRSNKFAILSNKLGRSVLYVLNDLFERIEKYNKLRIKFGQNLNNDQVLNDISEKFLNEKFNQQTVKNSDISSQRKSCLFGLFSFGKRRQATWKESISQNQQIIIQKNEVINNEQIELSKSKIDIQIKKTKDQNTDRIDKNQKIKNSIPIKQAEKYQYIQQFKQDRPEVYDQLQEYEIDQKTSSKQKTSLPATALVSPVLSPISIKSTSQQKTQDKKINPFQKVKRKK
ncbi:unnamed protein product [Paramecium pentaurelia]|uniref:VWFA domain-containing protein n=1 Tax=Paramecium pentaurelia TaxID=43138 RepID=A0A8S1RUD4_9CILI|nr:unnamed protein product [Paramecium pentaurelia]